MACAVGASALWVMAWTALVQPTTSGGQNPAGVIRGDALQYLTMVSGSLTDSVAPFCYRIGVPAVAKALPVPPETALFLITTLSLVATGAIWIRLGRRLGLSAHALLLGAVAAGSTQGWVGHFNNPYLTDGAGLLGVTALWMAWVCGAFGLSLAVLALAPLFRETVAPIAALWLAGGRGARGLVALCVAAAPLIAVRLWPDMPPSPELGAVVRGVMVDKGPLRLLGDALASYHALWLLALAGLSCMPAHRRRAIGPPLATMLLVACGLSVLALNTVRMFTLALPFMAMAVAELFEALLARDRAVAHGLAVPLLLGGCVWYPTRLFGAAISDHRGFQYAMGTLALVAAGWAFTAVRGAPAPVRAPPRRGDRPDTSPAR